MQILIPFIVGFGVALIYILYTKKSSEGWICESSLLLLRARVSKHIVLNIKISMYKYDRKLEVIYDDYIYIYIDNSVSLKYFNADFYKNIHIEIVWKTENCKCSFI